MIMSEDMMEKLDHGKVMAKMFFKEGEVTFDISTENAESKLRWVVCDYRDPRNGSRRDTPQKRTYKNPESALELLGRLCETARQPLGEQPMTAEEQVRFDALVDRVKVHQTDHIMVGMVSYDGLRGMSPGGRMRKPFVYYNIRACDARLGKVRFETIGELEAFAEEYFKIVPSRELALGHRDLDEKYNVMRYWATAISKFTGGYEAPKPEVIFGHKVRAHIKYGNACYTNRHDVAAKIIEDIEALRLKHEIAKARYNSQPFNQFGYRPNIFVESLYHSDKMIELY